MRIWIAVLVIIVVVIAAFAVYVIHGGKAQEPPPTAPAFAPIMLETFTDSYTKGTHTLHGKVATPDACTAVAASAQAGATSSDPIRVDISAVPDTGVCLQLPSEATYSVTADADIDAPVQVYVNGALATSTP